MKNYEKDGLKFYNRNVYTTTLELPQSIENWSPIVRNRNPLDAELYPVQQR